LDVGTRQLDVETRHALSLRGFGDFYLKNGLKTLKLLDMLNRSTGETTSSFFLKKNYLIWEGGLRMINFYKGLPQYSDQKILRFYFATHRHIEHIEVT
jgi:hypothetical protein